MATHERELTEPVDLCMPDGRRLNPAAKGWSRRPLHRANLRGRWGRTKRWDYWGILAGDLAIAVTYADVDYLGMVNVWWCDLATGLTGGRDVTVPLGRGVTLPAVPGSVPLRWSGRGLALEIVTGRDGSRFEASWTERDGRPATLRALVADPSGHESLNVVIPWDERRFQYTQKDQARPASGQLRVGDQHWAFGAAAGEAWGVLDVGRGRWPYRTNWNWAGGAGRAVDGEAVVGLQLGGKWTVGTGFTENGVVVDGRLTKIGDELAWDYSWSEPLQPWKVRSADGSLDLVLTGRYDKHTGINAGAIAMEVHQVFGTWAGTIATDEHGELRVDGIEGFAEESRSRW